MNVHRHGRDRICHLVCLSLLCTLVLSINVSADSQESFFQDTGASLAQGMMHGQLPPLLPSAFWGRVYAREGTLTEDTPVTAWIGSNQVAETKVVFEEDEPYYSLDVPPDDPQTPEVDGGMPGDTVRFRVGGLWTTEQSTWHTGATTRCDLSLFERAIVLCPLVLKH